MSVGFGLRVLILGNGQLYLQNLVAHSLAKLSVYNVLRGGGLAGSVVHFERLKNDIVFVRKLHFVLAPWAGRTLLLTLGEYHFGVIIRFILIYHA